MQVSGGNHGSTLKVEAVTPGQEHTHSISAVCRQQKEDSSATSPRYAADQVQHAAAASGSMGLQAVCCLHQAWTGNAAEGARLSSCCFQHQGGEPSGCDGGGLTVRYVLKPVQTTKVCVYKVFKMPGHGRLTTVQLEAVSSPSVMLAASAWRACLISSSRLELPKPSNFRSR